MTVTRGSPVKAYDRIPFVSIIERDAKDILALLENETVSVTFTINGDGKRILPRILRLLAHCM